MLTEIGQQVGKTAAQVALRWNVQRGVRLHFYGNVQTCSCTIQVAVIPKSLTPSRIESNFALDFELSEEQMKRVDGLNRNHRFVRVPWYDFEPEDAEELEKL